MTGTPTTTVQALNKTLEAPPLDPVVLAIANDYLAGAGPCCSCYCE